jgi:hypothetical protein
LAKCVACGASFFVFLPILVQAVTDKSLLQGFDELCTLFHAISDSSTISVKTVTDKVFADEFCTLFQN